MSDDERHGITLIGFIGSVFSPYYAWARRHGGGDAHNHCSLNVALYGAAGKRWAMTERRRGALDRSTDALAIGPSSMAWDGKGLTVSIEEVTAPLPSRLKGVVRLIPDAVTNRSFKLDAAGEHRWWPIAPRARVEVELSSPGLRWSGTGYFDTNSGDAPLEHSFVEWDWCRAPLARDTAILYHVTPRHGAGPSLALRCDASGAVSDVEPPPRKALPLTLWRLGRATGSEGDRQPTIVQTLTDAPFYARSVVRTHLLGEAATAMHESLSLDRFAAPWVQAMLPFRIPRTLR